MVLVPLETTVWTAKVPALQTSESFFFVLFFGRVTVCVRVCEMKAEIERGGCSVRLSNRLGCGEGVFCQLRSW